METHMHQLKSTDIMKVVLSNSLLWVPQPHSFIPRKQKMNCSCGVCWLTYWGQGCIPVLTQHSVNFTSQGERVINKSPIHIKSPELYLSKSLSEDIFFVTGNCIKVIRKSVLTYTFIFDKLPSN